MLDEIARESAVRAARASRSIARTTRVIAETERVVAETIALLARIEARLKHAGHSSVGRGKDLTFNDAKSLAASRE